MPAEQSYAVQVTHQVVEVYHVTARSNTEAGVALGMFLAGAESDDDVKPVKLVKTTKTVKRINPPRTLVDDPEEGDET